MDKTDYLYAFEALFREKCEAANIDSAPWVQGMWTNAHMHYEQGDSLEDGVAAWFEHVRSHAWS